MRACPICGTESDIRVGEVDGRALLICPQCRHVYWQQAASSEQVRQHYEMYYENDQAQIQDANRLYYRAHAGELALFLSGRAPLEPPRCIVDFGCSYPTFLEEARASGVARPVGIDYSRRAREYGARAGIEMWDPQHFIAGFDGQADVIRFSHVIEHFLDPLADFEAIIAHLAPRGIAYVTQPIFPVLRAETASLSFMDAVFPEHLHFFNPISLSRVLANAGLVVEEFFAFQAEEAVRALYEGSLDLAYAERSLAPGIGVTIPTGFSSLGARPSFCGQNCRVIARKTGGTHGQAV